MSSYKLLDKFDDRLPEIQVGKPTTLVGESTSQFLLKTTHETAPLYIQTPICNIKQGFVKGPNKKLACDLTFPNSESEFYGWVEQLERFSIDYINEKKKDWFKTDLSEEDVDNLFLSPFKIHRATKTYGMRVQINHLASLQIYDSSKEKLEHDDNFATDKPVIAVVEWVGIRCTVKNFYLEFDLKQLMLVENPLASECLIQKPGTSHIHKEEEKKEEEKEEEKEKEEEEKGEKPGDEVLEEIDIDKKLDETDETINLKTSSEVYQGIYEKALKRALMARDLGVLNYLESKNITDSSLLLDATEQMENGRS